MRNGWSSDQDRALTAINRWRRDGGQQVFRQFGAAGVGKTEVACAIGRNDPLVAYACPTGKAANVLRQRGCENVSTIHKLIYKTTWDPDKRRFHNELKPRDALDQYGMIVIDEASMVNAHIANELLSFRRPLLIVADPFQLPPPDGSSDGYFMHDKPDVMLTEIHRQAADNPILHFADRIRRGGSLPRVGYSAGGLVKVVNHERDIADHDVLLVRTNETRHHRNRRLRHQLGFVPRPSSQIEPQIGESVVCLIRYTEILWAEAQQLAVCNAAHDASPRLARWLLQCAGRTDSLQVPLTQEFPGEMLGLRRTSVTLLAQELQARGMIRYSRGRITILNRTALEACACECYRAIRQLYSEMPSTTQKEPSGQARRQA